MYCIIVCLYTLCICGYSGDANPTISTSTPTPCYGDVVTLVCHHPEVVSNRSRYFIVTPTWRENGRGVNLTAGSVFTAATAGDLTHTVLNITVAVKKFRNKSFNYSCVLLPGQNGLPTGEVETSQEVTVDPVGEWIYYEHLYILYINTSSYDT